VGPATTGLVRRWFCGGEASAGLRTYHGAPADTHHKDPGTGGILVSFSRRYTLSDGFLLYNPIICVLLRHNIITYMAQRWPPTVSAPFCFTTEKAPAQGCFESGGVFCVDSVYLLCHFRWEWEERGGGLVDMPYLAVLAFGRGPKSAFLICLIYQTTAEDLHVKGEEDAEEDCSLPMLRPF